MSEIFLTHMSWANDTPDDRNRFHQIALREARVATQHRQVAPAPSNPLRFASRLRLAFAGGQHAATESCTCPA